MDIKKLSQSLHPLERKVLPFITDTTTLSQLMILSKLSQVEVMRALQWLENKEAVKLISTVEESILLDENGTKYLSEGLPERKMIFLVIKSSYTLSELKEKSELSEGEFNIAFGLLKSKSIIGLVDGKVSVTDSGKNLALKESLEEKFLKKLGSVAITLDSLQDEERFACDALFKRKKIIKRQIMKGWNVSITDVGRDLKKISITMGDSIERLTPAMIHEGSWKDKPFRRYDVSVKVPSIHGGKRHFVNEAIMYIKRIWLDMGFTEMNGPIVHTSFWDLDALFVPQDHPARTMQDTFFVKDPNSGRLPSWHNTVKEMHEHGGKTGSTGWQYKWSEGAAKENLLRTHTTVLSAQAINRLKKEELPAKFFSVGKVYRNETLDWKHLFELHQVEGIVVDSEANLQNLKGYLKEFFGKMGFSDVRIRPAHFPYTEPSAEIDVFHPQRKEWVELGGSGIFRPEVTTSLMGYEVPVLAWGFGMERTIAAYYGITDIRELYRNNLSQIRQMKAWIK